MTWSTRTPLSQDWEFVPASNATAQETGGVTVTPMISPQGPQRSLKAENGRALSALLAGPIGLDARYNGKTLQDMLGAQNGVSGMLYRVNEETAARDGRFLCGAAPASHVVWHEPELIENRRLDLAVLSGGPPNQPGSALCAVLHYTRRSPSTPN